MATQQIIPGARSSLFLDLGTLASATYITSTALNLGSPMPIDVVLELVADPNGSPSSTNKCLHLFAKFSLDGTNYGSGPESGTTATLEADLHPIGQLPCDDTSEHRKFFSLFGGYRPWCRYAKIVVKNDLGVALTSGSVYYSQITGSIA